MSHDYQSHHQIWSGYVIVLYGTAKWKKYVVTSTPANEGWRSPLSDFRYGITREQLSLPNKMLLWSLAPLIWKPQTVLHICTNSRTVPYQNVLWPHCPMALTLISGHPVLLRYYFNEEMDNSVVYNCHDIMNKQESSVQSSFQKTESMIQSHDPILFPAKGSMTNFTRQHFRLIHVRRSQDAALAEQWESCCLTHLPLDEMAAISQTIFPDAFSWMKSFVFLLKFHWTLFLRVQLTITRHWFR